MVNVAAADTAVRPGPRSSASTTAWAGAAITLGAALSLLPVFGSFLPDGLRTFLLATYPADILLSQLVFGFACALLAFGWPGEAGVVGSSVLGKVALIAFGALPVLDTVLGQLWLALPAPADDLRSGLSVVISTVELLTLAAGIAAGMQVLRAGVLRGVARWALLIVAIFELALFAAVRLPSVLLSPEARDRLFESWNLTDFFWVLLVAGVLLRMLWGISYLAAGRRR